MWAHLSYETRCFPKGGPGSGSGAEEDEDEDGVLVRHSMLTSGPAHS